jgi:hypothetical protein
MISSTRTFAAAKVGPLLACLLVLVALPLASAGAAGAEIAYTQESLPEYEHQLASGQVKAATINKRIRTVRVTLADGRYVKAKYAAHQEPSVVKALEAKHVPVTVLSKAAADKEAKKGVHHKIRYIAGGILIAVVVIVGIVLVVDRRRKALRD